MDTEEKPAKPEGVNSEAAQPAAPGLKVVESYTPRLRSGAEGAGQTMIDPLTKRVIPVEQANEHMRIELMDPMWKKQSRRAARARRHHQPGERRGDERHDPPHARLTGEGAGAQARTAAARAGGLRARDRRAAQAPAHARHGHSSTAACPGCVCCCACCCVCACYACCACCSVWCGSSTKTTDGWHADPSCQSACARHACYAWYAHANAGHACYTHAHAGNPQHANAQYAYAEYARHAHFARHARHARYAHAHDGRYG